MCIYFSDNLQINEYVWLSDYQGELVRTCLWNLRTLYLMIEPVDLRTPCVLIELVNLRDLRVLIKPVNLRTLCVLIEPVKLWNRRKLRPTHPVPLQTGAPDSMAGRVGEETGWGRGEWCGRQKLRGRRMRK